MTEFAPYNSEDQYAAAEFTEESSSGDNIILNPDWKDFKRIKSARDNHGITVDYSKYYNVYYNPKNQRTYSLITDKESGHKYLMNFPLSIFGDTVFEFEFF